MKVQLNKRFTLNASRESAWDLLKDIPNVASCMPGAEITESVSEHHHKGKVKVKIGPVSTAFLGDIEVKEVTPDEYKIRMLGKGGDTKGSNASMDLTAFVQDKDGEVTLVGEADVTVGGKLASFGGRMMNQVADQILNQFGDNFVAKLAPSDAAEDGSQAKNELNAFALMRSIIVAFFKRLFGK